MTVSCRPLCTPGWHSHSSPLALHTPAHSDPASTSGPSPGGGGIGLSCPTPAWLGWWTRAGGARGGGGLGPWRQGSPCVRRGLCGADSRAGRVPGPSPCGVLSVSVSALAPCPALSPSLRAAGSPSCIPHFGAPTVCTRVRLGALGEVPSSGPPSFSPWALHEWAGGLGCTAFFPRSMSHPRCGRGKPLQGWCTGCCSA